MLLKDVWIEEVDERGSVPELMAHNAGERDVLVRDAEASGRCTCRRFLKGGELPALGRDIRLPDPELLGVIEARDSGWEPDVRSP